MAFTVSWTKADGTRTGFEGKDAYETYREFIVHGLHQAVGLVIADEGGVVIANPHDLGKFVTPEELEAMTGQTDDNDDKPA